MKNNNTLFFLALATLLIIALGAIYYQFQSREWAHQVSEQDEHPLYTQEEEFDMVEAEDSLEPDLELEVMPPISDDSSLETILKELEETVILEESFSDL